MVLDRGHRPHHSGPVRKARATLCLLALLAPLSLRGAEPWRPRLTEDKPGPWPAPPDFTATWTFGWSGLPAAEATTKITTQAETIKLEATGGTTGAARWLWQIDASLAAESLLPHFLPEKSEQLERYTRRTIRTVMETREDWLWRLRDTGDPGKARWKKVKISPVRDLFSGMLFIRSQPLHDGDRIGLVVYPGDSPFLVEATVEGRETLTAEGQPLPVIRLKLSIERINLKADGRLEPHGKFRSGEVWLSDDTARLPVRAEVDLFIGYVFAERTSLAVSRKEGEKAPQAGAE